MSWHAVWTVVTALASTAASADTPAWIGNGPFGGPITLAMLLVDAQADDYQRRSDLERVLGAIRAALG
jgi:hypothetical protein